MSGRMADSTATMLDTRENRITDLVQRHAELRSEITRGRRDLQRLTFEFQRIDMAIRELRGSAAAMAARPQTGAVSDVTRILFEVLDETDAPMTSRALALRIMEKLGIDAADELAAKYIVRRVCVCLWEQVQKGHFRKIDPNARPLKWERVRSAS